VSEASLNSLDTVSNGKVNIRRIPGSDPATEGRLRGDWAKSAILRFDFLSLPDCPGDALDFKLGGVELKKENSFDGGPESRHRLATPPTPGQGIKSIKAPKSQELHEPTRTARTKKSFVLLVRPLKFTRPLTKLAPHA